MPITEYVPGSSVETQPPTSAARTRTATASGTYSRQRRRARSDREGRPGGSLGAGGRGGRGRRQPGGPPGGAQDDQRVDAVQGTDDRCAEGEEGQGHLHDDRGEDDGRPGAAAGDRLGGDER